MVFTPVGTQIKAGFAMCRFIQRITEKLYGDTPVIGKEYDVAEFGDVPVQLLDTGPRHIDQLVCMVLVFSQYLTRDETRKRGFPTIDGVHMGPCEIHRRHAHTIGPDGSLYACPGFAGEAATSTGHIDGRRDGWRDASANRFDRLAAWTECNDCAFIPVCAGGCSTAAHTELGDMNKPNCHKTSFEAGLVSLARQAAAAAEPALAG